MKKKTLVIIEKTILIIVIIVFMVSCGAPSHHQHEARAGDGEVTVEYQFDWEKIGTVDDGQYGSFHLYEIHIDSVTYIIGTKYHGGITVLDKH